MLIAILLVAILPIRSATKRALLIGISEYPTNKTVKEATWPVIHGANDVQIIGMTLKSQGFRVSTLTNANATASKIRKALAKLQSEAKVGDIVEIMETRPLSRDKHFRLIKVVEKAIIL